MNFYLFWSEGELKLLMIILGLLACWLVRTRVNYENSSYLSKGFVETVISFDSTGEQVNKQELDKWVN